MDSSHILPDHLAVETTLILESGVAVKFNPSTNAELSRSNSRALVADATSNLSLLFDGNEKPFRTEDREGPGFGGRTIDAATVLDHCLTGYNRGNLLITKCPFISNLGVA